MVGCILWLGKQFYEVKTICEVELYHVLKIWVAEIDNFPSDKKMFLALW